MGICITCGTELPTQAHFCGICGTPLHPQTPSSIQTQPDESRLIAALPTNSSSAESSTPPEHPIVPLPTTGPYVPEALEPIPPRSNTTQHHKQRTITKWVIILLAILIIAAAGGSGVLAYILTRPQPVISLISNPYTLGHIPAGSNGTTLHIQGQRFSDNSAITFLLDNHALSITPTVVSDHYGTLNTNLPITAAWPLGLHILTAKDAHNYVSQKGIQVAIVAQGQAHTPGPDGAPPDDASFKMNVSVQEQHTSNGDLAASMDTLLISGNPDPAGGSVCKDRDNMQPHTYQSSTTSGLPDTLVYTFSCSGTYKNGQISYTETLLSAVITVNARGNSYVCHLLTAGVDEQLTGNYTAQSGFSGTVTLSAFPQSDFSCTTGQLPYFNFSLTGKSSMWSATYTLN
jgi:hypothetical protein